MLEKLPSMLIFLTSGEEETGGGLSLAGAVGGVETSARVTSRAFGVDTEAKGGIW